MCGCSDPNIMLCIINTKLRDFYSSLDELCEKEDLDINLILQELEKIGYLYNSELNQFKSK